MKLFAPHQKDFYKADHRRQYHEKTTRVYSNFTARSGKHSNVADGKGVVFVGLQLFIIDYLIDEWNESFFSKPMDEVVNKYKRRMSNAFGCDFDVEHIKALHNLGYLPIRIKALPEGSLVPYKVPMLTIVNTIDEFFWVTNMLESVLSTELWPMITTATTYREYLKVFYKQCYFGGGDELFVPVQAHDFSFRGMFGRHAAAKSSVATILCGSKGTDTVSGIDLAEEYYGFDSDMTYVGSVSATEHSVMSSNIEYLVEQGVSRSEAEYLLIKKLITEIYPTGYISIVCDTFDFWNVVGNIIPRLKDVINAREGKVIIRPDSGDPVAIMCGSLEYVDYDDLGNEIFSTYWTKCAAPSLSVVEGYLIDTKYYHDYEDSYGQTGEKIEIDEEIFKLNGEYFYFKQTTKYNCWSSFNGYTDDGLCDIVSRNHTIEPYERSDEEKGLVECLYEIMGGTQSDNGFITMNPKIGAIYGDSITLNRQKSILNLLERKGFSSSNVVLGVGSYSYQMVTRDTHGHAMKATAACVDGKYIDIFKDPKTDDGIKKSAKGLMKVTWDGEGYVLEDQVSQEEEGQGYLRTVFEDGMLIERTDAYRISSLVKEGIMNELEKEDLL